MAAEPKMHPVADDFESFRPKLTALAAKHMNPVLSRRLSPEDVVQETFAAALIREGFFEHEPDVPVYFKLRTVLLQTMTDLERRNLQAARRDARREVVIKPFPDPSAADADWSLS